MKPVETTLVIRRKTPGGYEPVYNTQVTASMTLMNDVVTMLLHSDHRVGCLVSTQGYHSHILQDADGVELWTSKTRYAMPGDYYGVDVWPHLDARTEPVALPYNGTAGWSGSETSRERETVETTTKRQRTVLNLLATADYDGLTWKEVAAATGWHHGQASGALSALHKVGGVSRLTLTRDRCKIYVLPLCVLNRSTESHGRKPKPCPHCGQV